MKNTVPLRWPLACLSLSMLMPSLDTSIANGGLPTLARALGASFQEVQWIVLAYLLAITALVVGVGRLGDLLGRRRLLLVGIGLFTIASLLCGVAPTLRALVGARAVQGLGAAIMVALTVALVGETVPKDRTGSVMGLLGTMSALGTTLGPSLGGALIGALGWRLIFLVNVPLGIVDLLLAWRFLPVDRRRPSGVSEGFDGLGSALLALTLGAYALALTRTRAGSGAVDATLLGAAAIGLAAFVAVERRASSPLIRWTLLRRPDLAASLASSALVATVMMTTLVVGPFYLAGALGLGVSVVGLALSAGPLVAALTGLPAGRLVDRLGPRRTAVLGLVGAASGCAALATLPATLGVPGYVGPIVLVTAGYALFQAANNTAALAGAGPEEKGIVSGMLSLSRNLGLITGASAMGAVFARAVAADAAAAHSEAVAAGMRTTFGIATTLMLAALAIALRPWWSATPATRRPGLTAARSVTRS